MAARCAGRSRMRGHSSMAFDKSGRFVSICRQIAERPVVQNHRLVILQISHKRPLPIDFIARLRALPEIRTGIRRGRRRPLLLWLARYPPARPVARPAATGNPQSRFGRCGPWACRKFQGHPESVLNSTWASLSSRATSARADPRAALFAPIDAF